MSSPKSKNKRKLETLVSWIGGNDLKATGCSDAEGQALGPIAATLKAQVFDRVELLYNYPEDQVKPYLIWLKKQIATPVHAQTLAPTTP